MMKGRDSFLASIATAKLTGSVTASMKMDVSL